MFDLIANTLTLAVSVTLPTFLSYKALQTTTAPSPSQLLHDPASATAVAFLSPWLTYWIVNSLLLSAHTTFSPILAYIPLYPWLRLATHVYLLIPGTAERIYQQHIRPPLLRHEREIESFISESHDRIKAQTYDALRNAVEWVRTVVLGEQKSAAQAEARAAPPRDATSSYVQTLLARFSVASSAQASDAAAGSSTGAGASVAGPQTQQAMWDLYDKVRTQVFAPGVSSSSGSGGPTTNFTSSSSSLHASPALSSADAATETGMKKSKSETEFEKIEREDADSRGAGGASSASGSASGATAGSSRGATWGSWLWGGKGQGHASHGRGHGHAKPKDE